MNGEKGAKSFSEKEIEEVLIPPKKPLLERILNRVESVVKSYPAQSLGLSFAIGILIGATLSRNLEN